MFVRAAWCARVGAVVGVVMGAGWVQARQAPAGPGGGILTPVGVAQAGGTDEAVRERRVVVDTAALPGPGFHPGAEVSIAFFADARFDLRVERVERRAGGTTWHGKVVGDRFGTFALTAEAGQVSGGVWTSRGAFGLAPTGERDKQGRAVCVARELRRDSVVRCAMGPGHPEVAPGDRGAPRQLPGESGARPGAGTGQRGAGAGGGPVPRGTSCDCGDDQSIVDVLVVYTVPARDAAGGLAALQARVQNALDTMNGALNNSGLNSEGGGGGPNRLQVRLAGMTQVDYDEQAPAWLDHLVRVTEPADGFLDGVHALRNEYHADVVSLVVDDPRFTGGAAWWALWDEAQAFSCINWRGLGSGSLTFAHELGHNFGCAHDHENDVSAPFFYAWGHYFTHEGTVFGTIMAYPGDVHVQYYSNPQLVIFPINEPAGAPLSSPRAAFNARTIAQTRWTLANFRDGAGIVDCNGNGVDDAIDLANGPSVDTNHNCRPDEVEDRLYVDGTAPAEGTGVSWADPIKDLANALAFATLHCNNVKEIWVADGVYKPDRGTGDRYASFALRSGLALYGGFQGRSRPGGGETLLSQRDPVAYPAVLSGDIGAQGVATDNSYSVVTARLTGANAVLDGFQIRGGYSDFSGAGIYLDQASPTITGCVIADNRAGTGGGVVLDGNFFAGEPVFSRCAFLDNTAVFGGGGISAYHGLSVTLDRCTFINNTGSWGGAVAGDGEAFTIRSCIFEGNHADTYNGGALDFNQCIFTLANSIVAGNTSAQDGAGVWSAAGSTGSVVNCTIHGNTAGTFTGGLVAYNDTVDITGTILWGNAGTHAAAQGRQLVYFGATGAVRYSRVQGWTGALGGPGNSGADPMLTNPNAADFTLRAHSPCIDAGSNAALPPGLALDVLGQQRRRDDPDTGDTGVGPAPVVDIGAVEFQGASGPPACPGDFNGDGTANSQDFFDFLTAFFSNDPSADFNRDGTINSQDFFDFLVAFFTPC